MKHLNLLLMCIFVCWSCSSGGNDEPIPPKPDDKPVIEIPSSQSSPVLEQTGGTASVSFSTDAAWTATVNEAATRAATWISVSPTSGNAGSHTLAVTTTENDTYDERNATVILKAGTTSKTFTVKQKQKDALTVTSSKIELTAIGGQATIEVKANVQYQYEVEQAAQSWITRAATTRGLTSSSLVFDVAENENTERREGKITLRSGNLSETVTIYQEGSKPTLVLTQNEYTVGSDGETIKVELKSNTEYEVKLPADGWITETQTRAFSSHTHYFTVAANEGYDARTAEIIFVNKDNGVEEKVKVTQVQKDAIIIAQSEYTVPATNSTLDFEINTNVDFSVSISNEWIKQVSTRGLVKKTLHFTMEENISNEVRTGNITVFYKEIKQIIKVTQDAPINERDILIAFYKATNGDNWERNRNWCSNQDISTWDGVTVKNGHVIELTMINNRLRGELPADIGKLAALKVLYLSGEYTYLSGRIPEEIGNLTNLEYLSLYGPELGGEIPSSIGNLKKLHTLNLSSCKITGQIPEELYNCQALKDIDLSGNHISGTISDKIANLKSLERFSICQTNISGEIPEEITQLINLEWFYAYENQLSGPLPANIGNLSKLKYFIVNNCNLTGSIPTNIGNCASLESFNIHNNKLTGEIPASIGNCTKLRYLSLNFNELTGNIPASIGNCSNLRGVDIRNNKLSGNIPASLSKLMEHQDMFSLTGDGGSLWINNNNLSGKIPDEITGHKNFALCAYRFLLSQNPGYGFDYTNFKFPARKDTYYNAIDGKPINMGEEYTKGKYTLVFRHGLNACMYSKEFLPTILNLHKKYGNKGLNIICSLVLPASPSSITAEIKQLGMDLFPHFTELITNETFNPYFVEYAGCMSTPFATVIDNEGNFIFITETDKTAMYDKNYTCVYPIWELEAFINNLFKDEKDYESTDYSKDGNVTILQKATEGNGIDIVLMGDAFSDRLIADGTYETTMKKAADFLFTEEPFKTYRNLFNVYMVDAVSKNEVYDGETALSTYFGDGTFVGGNNDKCFDYAQKAIPDSRIDEAMIVVMINSTRYAGTCHMYISAMSDYGSGPSISYFPVGNDDTGFEQLLHHEANGHGFSKLADEYAYQEFGAMPTDEIRANQELAASYGWNKNVDFTSDPTQVKWSKYLSDSRYSNDGLGVFEGACTYWTGAYRPTDVSIMRYNTDGFNAPSREAIYYRIHKLAYGTPWAFNYEDFVTYDAKNRKASTRSTTWNPAAIKRFRENHCPPVVIRKNWRSAE